MLIIGMSEEAPTVEQLAAEIAAIRKTDLANQRKQQKLALETLRKNELRIEEEKHKSSPANVRLITVIKKVGYRMENMLTSWGSVVEDPENYKPLVADGLTISPIHQGNLCEAGLAFIETLEEIKQVKKYLAEQQTLVEAATFSKFGWHAAQHMENEKGVFSVDDGENMDKLRKCEGYVRRDRKSDTLNKRGTGRGGRNNYSNMGKRTFTRWNVNPLQQQMQSVLGSYQLGEGSSGYEQPLDGTQRRSQGWVWSWREQENWHSQELLQM